MASETNETREKSLNFLEEIIEESIAKGETRVQTRFPPEPNGYLHIGHAKSICINFGLAKKYGGKCNLRFDDTNPVKEDVEYVDSIKRDIQWLGFDWAVERYASDYFDQLYDWAIVLIKKRVGIRRRPDTGADPRKPRYGFRTGHSVAVARPLRGGKPRPVRPHEKRRIPRRGQGAARQDRHGAPQHALPRPDHVPHHPCRASPHGQQVVHLPDVRLCPRPERLDRADHPLDLHARIRRAPSSLRLVHPGAGDLPFAPVRIRPAEPHLHDDVEAQAAQTRAGRRRDGLGRPPHADDLRFAPQGLYPRPRCGTSPRWWASPSATT